MFSYFWFFETYYFLFQFNIVNTCNGQSGLISVEINDCAQPISPNIKPLFLDNFTQLAVEFSCMQSLPTRCYSEISH